MAALTLTTRRWRGVRPLALGARPGAAAGAGPWAHPRPALAWRRPRRVTARPTETRIVERPVAGGLQVLRLPERLQVLVERVREVRILREIAGPAAPARPAPIAAPPAATPYTPPQGLAHRAPAGRRARPAAAPRLPLTPLSAAFAATSPAWRRPSPSVRATPPPATAAPARPPQSDAAPLRLATRKETITPSSACTPFQADPTSPMTLRRAAPVATAPEPTPARALTWAPQTARPERRPLSPAAVDPPPEPHRPPEPLPLTWRAPGKLQQPAQSVTVAPIGHTPADPPAASLSATPPLGQAPLTALPAGLAPAAPPALDPVLAERLAADVMRRIERNLRIERERRGL